MWDPGLFILSSIGWIHILMLKVLSHQVIIILTSLELRKLLVERWKVQLSTIQHLDFAMFSILILDASTMY